MTDKVQKIREFLVGIAEADGVNTILAKAIEKKILPYIDSMQEEPVNEDLEEIIDAYLATYWGGEKEKKDWPFLKKMAIHFAKWQKEQMMKGAIDVTVKENADGFPYVQSTIEMYDYVAGMPLAKKGDKYKVVLIKET